MIKKRPPEARQVMDESTIVVHRTHDLDEARQLACADLGCRPDEPAPDWIATGGEAVWLRTYPAAPDHEYAYFYRAAREGDRGAFRAVVFTTEPECSRWWSASADGAS